MNTIDQAIKILKNGRIIIFPTDTAFGIGCRIDDENAVGKLFDIRRRPLIKATPVLVDSISMALIYLKKPPATVIDLMHRYWPGALTIVASCKKELILSPIRGGGETIGVRMPNHQDLLKLIKEVGVPILGPSANFHGKTTPYQFSDLDPELIKLVDFVMPGECSIKQVSTVVDATGEPLKILRQGAVKIDLD